MKSPLVQAKEFAEFMTVTCLDWKPLLTDDAIKDIITGSLSFLCQSEKVNVYAFVIMSNHFHVIWQMLGDHKREHVQRDFLKYTSQRILRKLRDEKSPLHEALLVDLKDRKYQVWQRNSLGIPLWSDKVIWQKLEYIHYNPVSAGLCLRPEDYKYSSARFYADRGYNAWGFLVHVDG
jgi:putative transposase